MPVVGRGNEGSSELRSHYGFAEADRPTTRNRSALSGECGAQLKDVASDAVNREVARAYSRVFLRDGDYAYIDRTLRSQGNADDFYWYFTALWIGWLCLVPIVELLSVPVAYTASTLFGDGGNSIAVKAFVFCAAFCITGAADAIWRYHAAAHARRLTSRGGEVMQRRARNLLSVARLPTATLLLQAAVALLLAFRV